MLLLKAQPATRVSAASPGCYQVAPVRPVRGDLQVVNAQKKPATNESGFIKTDNSGRANIFPTSSKAYYQSPTSSAVASSGLGGSLGVGVIAAAIGIVVIATVGVIGKEQAATLGQVTDTYSGDSLTEIAKRLSQ